MLDDGDSAGLQDSFENHFRDMFLNVTSITYHMHAQFWASLIVFLVTSCLNWPRNCMLIVHFVLWYEMMKATAARAHLCVQKLALRSQDRFRARLPHTWRWSEVEARLKRLQFDVVVRHSVPE